MAFRMLTMWPSPSPSPSSRVGLASLRKWAITGERPYTPEESHDHPLPDRCQKGSKTSSLPMNTLTKTSLAVRLKRQPHDLEQALTLLVLLVLVLPPAHAPRHP